MTATQKRSRFGLAAGTILVAVIAVLALAGGVWVMKGPSGEPGAATPDVFEVRRGGFDITIPASGELAAASQKEIICKLEVRATITEIEEQGKFVKAGDVLIRFNDEEIKERIKDAEDALNAANTDLINARSTLDIRRQSHESELDKADLQIKLADLALQAWRKGTAVSTRRRLELAVETSRKDYDRLQARFDASADLLRQEFISQDEYQQDEIRMINARSDLEQATLAVEVFNNFDFEKDDAKFVSDLEQATDERSRLEQRHVNEIASLESDVASAEYKVTSRKERLDRYRGQLADCIVRAPQDGLVVYAASLATGRHGRGDSEPPKVGDELRRNETVIILPDTSRMVAEVKVNEALMGKIEAGQQAVLYSDSRQDVPLRGTVLDVGILAESGGWRDPNRRDYTVRIELVGTNDLELKPSMRCRASIAVGRVEDAMYVPVQAVFREGPVAYVYVPDGAGYAQRQVSVGRSSELYIEVMDGVAEGDRVLLREPEAEQITASLDIESNPVLAGNGAGDRGQDGPRRKGAGGKGTNGKGTKRAGRGPADNSS